MVANTVAPAAVGENGRTFSGIVPYEGFGQGGAVAVVVAVAIVVAVTVTVVAVDLDLELAELLSAGGVRSWHFVRHVNLCLSCRCLL